VRGRAHVGLRPVTLSVRLISGFFKERGHDPRFAASESDLTTNMKADIVAAFERELDAIAHDRAFDGVEIVAHRARSVARATEFTVTIDAPGGADLALCERMAARINGGLSVNEAEYSLVVESAGLDRPLVRSGDYERFAGERVRIVTSLSIGGNKTHRGILRGLRGEAVVMETERGELILPMAAIKSANLEYDVRLDLARDKKQRKQLHGND
jgi:ribosome maturation factor RimP